MTGRSIKISWLGVLIFLCFGRELASAQVAGPLRPKGKKSNFFIFWGYNRSAYTRSNLHFTGPTYNFTLHHVHAKDRPSELGWVYLEPTTFTIPQYEYRVGYYFKDRFALSIGLDHLKYVVAQDQESHITGHIDRNSSTKFGGDFLDQPIVLSKDFLQFEHTDGMNLLGLDLEYLHPLLNFAKGNLQLYWNTGLGFAGTITKTDVHVMGFGMDNKFHLAGFAFTGKTGPRIEFRQRIFLKSELQGGYAHLPSVLIHGSAPDRARHSLGYVEGSVAFGVNFRVWKPKK